MKRLIPVLICVLVLLVTAVSFAQDKHVIEAGDTLRKLAAKYDTTVLELLGLLIRGSPPIISKLDR